MKKLIILVFIISPILPLIVEAQSNCAAQEKVEGILKYHLWNLEIAEYNKQCLQVTQGDFNGDGKEDYAAVLTEVKPHEQYADGSDWYRTYVAVFIDSDLPYNKYQIIFVRTDGNKPKDVSVKSIKTKHGNDFSISLKGYSYTRYRWGSHGFKAIQHSAD